MKKHTIALLVGSLRKDSLNRKTAKAIETLSSGTLEFRYMDIGKLELYNQDLDEAPPESWKRFREAVKSCEGVLFVTPEYNRSVPGVLKNAIDVGSRPYGKSVWEGKPAAVVSVSPGAPGGFGANHHLRQSLVFLNMPAMQQPEAYIGGAGDLFDDKGEVKKSDTKEFLKNFSSAFAEWVDQHVAR